MCASTYLAQFIVVHASKEEGDKLEEIVSNENVTKNTEDSMDRK